MIAYDAKKRKQLWQTSFSGFPDAAAMAEGAPVIVAGFGVGEERVYTTPGLAMLSSISVEGEASSTGVGGPISRDPAKATCLSVDEKERWIWIGDDRGTMTRLNPEDVNGWSRRAMKNDGVTCAAEDASAKLLAVGGKDGTVRFVNPKSASVDDKLVFDEHRGQIVALAWDAKKGLAVASSEGELWIWSVSGKKVSTRLPDQESTVRSLCFGGKGKWLAAGDAQGLVRIYARKDGRLLATLDVEGEAPIHSLCLSDKGKTLVAAGDRVTLWDVSGLK